MGLGGTGGVNNWDRIFEKTRVGFGRAELSLRLSCTELCALSSGHGPSVKGFQAGSSRVDFHVFQGVKDPRQKLETLPPKKNPKNEPLTIGE